MQPRTYNDLPAAKRQLTMVGGNIILLSQKGILLQKA